MDIRALEEAKQQSIEVFCCYAREDQPLLLSLIKHLTPLQREGLITLWADVNINAGMEWEKEIHSHLNTARIILLLISPDFMASDYCYSIEMQHAMQRHKRGEAIVIPIILRPVSWQRTPFGALQALPTDASPIVSRDWYHPDEAFYAVAEGLRNVIERINSHPEVHSRKPREKSVEKPQRASNPGQTVSAYETSILTTPEGGSPEGERRHFLKDIQSDASLQTGAAILEEASLTRAQTERVPEPPAETVLLLPPAYPEVVQRRSSFIQYPAGEQPANSLASEALIPLPPTNPRFAMSLYQVTNREFQIFLDANTYWHRGGQGQDDGKVDSYYLAHWADEAKNIPEYPVVNVSWHAAEAYVNWLGEQRHQRLRLPTQEEWEIAARCGRTSKEWWREEIEEGRVNYSETEGEIRRVSSFGANPYGFYNILGNVYELCSSSQGSIVACGGAFHSSLSDLITPISVEPQECREDVGFRFVQNLID